MGSAMTMGLLLGGASAASNLINSQQQAQAQASSAKAQAAQYDAQARNLERQARIEAEKGRVEAEEIDRRKVKMRREFEDLQGKNRSMLAAGNVDMQSGSALDNSMGNINMFAEDIGDNAYQKAMKEWETKSNVDALNTQAGNAREAGRYYNEQASSVKGGSILPSLLNAAIGGASGFVSGYGLAGGKVASLFGGGDESTTIQELGKRARNSIWGAGLKK